MTPSPSPSSAVRAAVDELQELLEKATPGMWVAMDYDDDPDDGGCALLVGDPGPGQRVVAYTIPYSWTTRESCEADAKALVAAMNLAPHLLAAVKAVDELADRLERTSPKPQAGGFFAEELRDTLRAALALAAVDVTETAE